MKAVIDSSSLIFLFKSTTLLSVVEKRFDCLVIPKAVYEEIVIQGKAQGKSDAVKIEQALQSSFFEINKEANEIRILNIGKGEREAIFLAEKHKLPLLMDDRAAQKIAISLGINTIPLSAFILWAAKNSHLSKKQAIQTLDELVKSGYYLKSHTYITLREAIEHA